MKRFSYRAFSAATVVAFLGILSTYFFSMQIEQQQENQVKAKIQARAMQLTASVQESVNLAISDLLAVQALYHSDVAVSLNTFQLFSRGLLKNTGHFQALQWIPSVAGSSRDEFEKMHQLHYPNFRIMERKGSGELIASKLKRHYYPVAFIEPFEENKAVLGFDLNSSKNLREAVAYSRDSGELAATGKIRLIQEKSSSFGFLVFAPVYNRIGSLVDAGARELGLEGFAVGVFRVDSLMKNANKQALAEGLSLSLVDLGTDDGGVLFGKKVEGAAAFELSVPNRHWRLEVSRQESMDDASPDAMLINWTMEIGSVISILLATCLYALLRIISSAGYIKQLSQQLKDQNLQLEDTVAERTDSLALKNQTLNENIEQLTTQRKILASLTQDAALAQDKAERRAVELARSNRDLDDFAYVASHDLKSPLRGIDQLASWVIEDLGEGNLTEIPEHLLLMRKRVQRLETLLNDLLDYARVGRQEKKISEIDCKKFFEDVFLLNSPPVNFELVLGENLPVFSTAFAPFEQVIRNFISNVIKHHDRADGLIVIGCIEQDTLFEFSVYDDGPGIDANHHQQIFKMFKTLKSRDDVEGSGMGLALIKRIVEYYGGQVRLESSIGKGTKFFFTWPKTILKANA